MADAITLGSDNRYVLNSDFETMFSAIADGTKMPISGLSMVPYYQQNGYPDVHQAWVTTEGRGNSKAVKFILRPWSYYDPTQTNTDYRTASQVFKSSFGIGDRTTLNGAGNRSDCVEGDDFWGGAWIKFSPNWSWGPGTGSSLKIIRFYPTRYYNGELIIGVSGNGQVSGVTQGWVGGGLNLSTGTNGVLYGTSGDTSLCGPTAYYPVGEWFKLDVHIKISATPATAVIRVWINDTLVMARYGNASPYADRQTLTRTGTAETLGCPGTILYSTWDVDGGSSGPTLPNGEQSVIYDNIVVTNDPVWVQANGRQDGAGNWLIGRSYGAPVPTVGVPTISANPIVGQLVTLSSTAAYYDPATDVDVSFYDGDPDDDGVLIGTDTSTPFSVNWNPNTSGAHSIYAKATDDNVPALSAVSSPLAVTVGDVPTVGAPVVSGVLTVGNTLTLTSSVTLVAPATSATVRFYDSDDVLIGTDTSSPYSVTYAPTLAKSYGVYAVATDDTGLVATSSTTHFTMASANPATVDSLRTEIKEGAMTNGMAALATALNASPFKLPGGGTNNEKILNALVPLMGFELLRQRGSNEVFPYSDGEYRSGSLARYAHGQLNLMHTVYSRIHQLYELADSTSNLTALQDIVDTELTRGWP